jgi:hypothetical protein
MNNDFAGDRSVSSPFASTPQEPSTRGRKPVSTLSQFTDGLGPCQLQLPRDLIQSLRLTSIQQGRTLSAVALDYLTSDQALAKCWISTRKSSDAA